MRPRLPFSLARNLRLTGTFYNLLFFTRQLEPSRRLVETFLSNVEETKSGVERKLPLLLNSSFENSVKMNHRTICINYILHTVSFKPFAFRAHFSWSMSEKKEKRLNNKVENFPQDFIWLELWLYIFLPFLSSHEITTRSSSLYVDFKCETTTNWKRKFRKFDAAANGADMHVLIQLTRAFWSNVKIIIFHLRSCSGTFFFT